MTIADLISAVIADVLSIVGEDHGASGAVVALWISGKLYSDEWDSFDGMAIAVVHAATTRWLVKGVVYGGEEPFSPTWHRTLDLALAKFHQLAQEYNVT